MKRFKIISTIDAFSQDISAYAAIQTVLRDEIVNPLRTSHFVRADRVLRLRKMLEEVCSVKGLTTEEKDPEEFLNILLAETLKAQPFLQLNSGQEAFCYQLFVDKDDQLAFPTVQQLFDQSLLCGDIKLRTVPSCLIVQMPRFGKEYKMYSRILPSLVLDVTDVIANCECKWPRFCATNTNLFLVLLLLSPLSQRRVSAAFAAMSHTTSAKIVSPTRASTPSKRRHSAVTASWSRNSITMPTEHIGRASSSCQPSSGPISIA